MPNQSTETTPITLLTGFLGSGKTTLLNHILNGKHGLRVAVLVNDFGSINIDAQLVIGVEGEAVSLANGCICCTIRGDLLDAVEGILSRQPPVEYIIIEASGVSDPAQVVYTFIKSHLKDRVTIDAILTLVDAEQFGVLEGQNRQLAHDQIRAADIVILNKVDLVNEEQLDTLQSQIRQLVPQARILETIQANVPLTLILGVGNYDTARLPAHTTDVHIHNLDEPHAHTHTHDHSLVFSTWYWSSEQPLHLQKLRRVIDNLSPSIYRAKGIIYLAEMPEQQGILQVVGQRVSLSIGEAWNDKKRQTQIVFIGDEDSFESGHLHDKLVACAADSQSSSSASNPIEQVLNWVRGKKG